MDTRTTDQIIREHGDRIKEKLIKYPTSTIDQAAQVIATIIRNGFKSHPAETPEKIAAYAIMDMTAILIMMANDGKNDFDSVKLNTTFSLVSYYLIGEETDANV